MFLNYISQNGEVLNLTRNQYFHLTRVDGMTIASTNISTNVIGGIDGDSLNNVQAQPRGMILSLRIKNGVNVEEAKRAITSVVKLKQNATLVWEQNNKKLQIVGVVEAVEMERWELGVPMQITLHCGQPFWEDIDYIVQQIDEALNLHYFTTTEDMLYFTESGRPLGEYNISRTRTIVNGGDVEIGMEIEILAYKTVTNPIIYGENGTFFGVGYGTGIKKVTMQAGDIIRISTQKGHKNVTMNGTNIMGRIMRGSTWLQLKAGKNTFSISSDDPEEVKNNVTFSLIYKQRYI